MTEYKVGDRLRGIATGVWTRDSGPEREGVFDGHVSRLFGTDGWPHVVGGEGGGAYLDPRESIDVVRPGELSFVGPEPEPAKAPAVTTPFRVATTGTLGRIVDSRGHQVAEFLGDQTSERQDVDLAALVVELLNAHFGAK